LRDTGLLRELQKKAYLHRSSKRPLKAPRCGLLCRRAPRRPSWSLLFPSSTSSRVREAANVEDSNSVHGFGYCIRDRRHVPAAEPLVLADSEGLYDNKLQRSGPKAAARKHDHLQAALHSQPTATMSASLLTFLKALPQIWQTVVQQTLRSELLGPKKSAGGQS